MINVKIAIINNPARIIYIPVLSEMAKNPIVFNLTNKIYHKFQKISPKYYIFLWNSLNKKPRESIYRYEATERIINITIYFITAYIGYLVCKWMWR